jgi:hypothetical protein
VSGFDKASLLRATAASGTFRGLPVAVRGISSARIESTYFGTLNRASRPWQKAIRSVGVGVEPV